MSGPTSRADGTDRAVGPWRRLSLRGRLVALGTVGVALALALGSLSLYAVLGVAGARALDSSAAATADDVVQLVRDGRLPEPIPVTGNQVVQVLDGRGRVVSASTNADRLTTLLSAREVAAAVDSPVTVPGSRIGTGGTLRVVAVRVSGRSSPGRTVLVAQAADDVEHAQHVLGATLLATYPVLLLVLALIAWRVVGAALRPVESLRAAADEISGAGGRERLPEPPSRDELRALALTLNSMLDRLAGSRERQRSFVADAAHELRSPLASMRTQLEVAERRGEAPEVVPDLVEEVRRMTHLVEDLLVLARLDDPVPAAGSGPTPDPVDLTGLLTGVVVRHEAGRVRVVLEASPVATAALARPEHLVRAVDNLVTNAVRHATSRVVVRLEPASASTGASVTVLDDGHGVPAADRDRVFERFTRLDEARDRDAGGSGLGLAIARQLVEGLGGSISVDEAPGGGAAFVVRLPSR